MNNEVVPTYRLLKRRNFVAKECLKETEGLAKWLNVTNNVISDTVK